MKTIRAYGGKIIITRNPDGGWWWEAHGARRGRTALLNIGGKAFYVEGPAFAHGTASKLRRARKLAVHMVRTG